MRPHLVPLAPQAIALLVERRTEPVPIPGRRLYFKGIFRMSINNVELFLAQLKSKTGRSRFTLAQSIIKEFIDASGIEHTGCRKPMLLQLLFAEETLKQCGNDVGFQDFVIEVTSYFAKKAHDGIGMSVEECLWSIQKNVMEQQTTGYVNFCKRFADSIEPLVRSQIRTCRLENYILPMSTYISRKGVNPGINAIREKIADILCTSAHGVGDAVGSSTALIPIQDFTEFLGIVRQKNELVFAAIIKGYMAYGHRGNDDLEDALEKIRIIEEQTDLSQPYIPGLLPVLEQTAELEAQLPDLKAAGGVDAELTHAAQISASAAGHLNILDVETAYQAHFTKLAKLTEEELTNSGLALVAEIIKSLDDVYNKLCETANPNSVARDIEFIFWRANQIVITFNNKNKIMHFYADVMCKSSNQAIASVIMRFYLNFFEFPWLDSEMSWPCFEISGSGALQRRVMAPKNTCISSMSSTGSSNGYTQMLSVLLGEVFLKS